MSLIPSRLRLERYREADLDVAAQRVRDRAALLALLGEPLELGRVEPATRPVTARSLRVMPLPRGSKWQTASTARRSATWPAVARVFESAIA